MTNPTGTHRETPDPITAAAQALRDFQAGTSPTNTANWVMIVGTGGTGIWERLWSRMMPAPQEQEHMLRAMGFASDLARDAEVSIANMDQSFFRMTKTAIEMAQRFQQDLEQCGITPPEPAHTPESPANRFARTFPDWHTRWTGIRRQAEDTLDLGKHLALLSILEENPYSLVDAIEIIGTATEEYHQTVQELDPSPRTIQPPTGLDLGTDARNAAINAAGERLEYVRQLTQRHRQDHPEARRVIASAVIAHDAHLAQTGNTRLLRKMPAGPIRTTLRDLSDRILRENHMEITQRTVDALTEGNPEETRNALQLIMLLQDFVRTAPGMDHPAIEASVQARMTDLQQQFQGRDPAGISGIIQEIPAPSARGGLPGILAADAELRLHAAADAVLRTHDPNGNRPDPRVIMSIELQAAFTIIEMIRHDCGPR